MRLLLIVLTLFFFVTASGQKTCDVLIVNGRVIDGTGNSWFNADVAIKDGKIFAIGKLIGYNAPKIIDAKKMIVAPGFIDVHAHIESSIFQNPDAGNYILDGVTTVVTGNCGSSVNSLQNFFYR